MKTRRDNPTAVAVAGTGVALTIQRQNDLFEQYCLPGMTLLRVSQDSGIPLPVIQDAAKAGNWAERRKTFIQEIVKSSDEVLALYQAEKQTVIAKQTVTIAEKMLDTIDADVNAINILDPGDGKRITLMRRLSEAFGTVSTIALRATSADSKTMERMYDGKVGGKVPLIMMGVKGTVTVQEGAMAT